MQQGPVIRTKGLDQDSFERSFQIPQHLLLGRIVERERGVSLGCPRQPFEQNQGLVSGQLKCDGLAIAQSARLRCRVVAIELLGIHTDSSFEKVRDETS